MSLLLGGSGKLVKASRLAGFPIDLSIDRSYDYFTEFSSRQRDGRNLEIRCSQLGRFEISRNFKIEFVFLKVISRYAECGCEGTSGKTSSADRVCPEYALYSADANATFIHWSVLKVAFVISKLQNCRSF